VSERFVRRARNLSGVLRMPSDKSIGHRALIANAIASGQARVGLTAPGVDLRSTIRCLQALGVQIDVAESATGVDAHVTGSPELPDGARDLDCGNSGTTMRLLAGVMATREGSTLLDGDASLRRRPMERVAAPLRAMGAHVSTSAAGTPPVQIDGRRPLRGMRHKLPVASAQLLGAVVFAGLTADGDTEIELPATVRDHTERLLAWMGARIGRVDERRTLLRSPSPLTARSLDVPGDPSSAAAWMVAAAIHPDARLRVAGLTLNPTRLAMVELLREMGASLSIEPLRATLDGPEPLGDVVVTGGQRLEPIRLSGGRVAALIDELPLVGIAMGAANGTSELRDAGELRVKESDRIAATVAGLDAIGARVRELPDGWQVSPGSPRSARIQTHGDHRMAIAFAIGALAGVAGEVLLDDADCIAVSYPSFWDDLATASAAAGASV
jgi:3-phosphoshikimate 1-carboxyvinyltransferase